MSTRSHRPHGKKVRPPDGLVFHRHECRTLTFHTGLLHSLLGIDSREQLFSYPGVGQSWEGHVIEQLLSSLTNLGKPYDAFHARFANGREIDLVVQCESRLWAIAIRLTSNPSVEEYRLAVETSKLLGATNTLLICRTANLAASRTNAVCDLAAAIRFLLDGRVI